MLLATAHRMRVNWGDRTLPVQRQLAKGALQDAAASCVAHNGRVHVHAAEHNTGGDEPERCSAGLQRAAHVHAKDAGNHGADGGGEAADGQRQLQANDFVATGAERHGDGFLQIAGARQKALGFRLRGGSTLQGGGRAAGGQSDRAKGFAMRGARTAARVETSACTPG